MHGCNTRSGHLINAEVDSMGGIVDSRVGIGVKTSPHRASIEKAQAELRLEYDFREERRRELEFLEKGGNPLDLKFGNGASVSFQSTSLTDQQAEHFVISEAKGSFALTASPHGDSVESSGKPGFPVVCEPHTADNLLLLNGENESHESKRNSGHRTKRSIPSSEQSFQRVGTQNVKEAEDSAIFRPYARRNRSKTNRDNSRSSSTDIVQSRGCHGSLPAHGGSKDFKGLITETNSQKEHNPLSVSKPITATLNGNLVSEKKSSDNVQAVEATKRIAKGSQSECMSDTTASRISSDVQQKELTKVEVLRTSINLASDEPDTAKRKEDVVPAGLECLSGVAATKSEKEPISGWVNGSSDPPKNKRTLPISGQQSSNAAVGAKILDSESSCTQNRLHMDANSNNDFCFTEKVDANEKPVYQTSELEGKINCFDGDIIHESNEKKPVDDIAAINEINGGASQKHALNDSIVNANDGMRNETCYPSDVEGLQRSDSTVSEADKKVNNVSGDVAYSKTENYLAGKPQGTVHISICELPKITLLEADNVDATDPQNGSDKHPQLVDKSHEDSILEEARIIEAKRKRIAELSLCVLPREHRWKSHWDFVVEEMTWLANDFAQERLWKITAAAQISRYIAFTSRHMFEEQNQRWNLKKIALTLANAVMQFWHSAQILLNNEETSTRQKNCGNNLVGSCVSDANKVSEDKNGELDMGTRKEVDQMHPRKNIQEYALRFLNYNSSPVHSLQAEAPATPDRKFESGSVDVSWDGILTEESLFYAVSLGSMEAYRKCIEPYLLQSEKTGSSVQEEVETSAYDAGEEFGYNDSVYDDDERDTSTYYFPGSFEGSKPSKTNRKRRKHLMRSYSSRPCELGADVPYGNHAVGPQPRILLGKRPAYNLNFGSVPTKRMRSSARSSRVVSPFNGAPASGIPQTAAKTDASSGDTSSFQDDESTLHGGSYNQKSMEVESILEFEKQLPFDHAETQMKPKKKKRPKHNGSGFDQGWQHESTMHGELRDYSRKRFENHHRDSNGTKGLYVQHNSKKPKIMRPHLDGTYDITPGGSLPSPVASQVSNMSNPNKFIKFIGGRDRGRKPKALKMAAGQQGSGSPWSLFEDQALVVLVHDMGPNWELVSDAINTTLKFKCIFRKPKDCKERHKTLMDKTGDGADSADDSGSSQSYPSTLPGIPKGSARQLFQHLQGPMEEDALKSHFDKIIMMEKKQRYRRIQNNQDAKPVVTAHSSHYIALSQVCPSNLNGVLTPLDLCDLTTSSQDVLPIAYQPGLLSSLAVSNQGSLGSVLPASGSNSSLQSSSAMVVGNNISLPSTPLNISVRDGRYGVPRTSLPAEEQQRVQQYNHLLSGRNIQQSNLSVPGSGGERGICIPSGGVLSGTNRSMPVSRPGFQGMASSSMLNSGSMHSSNMVGMPNVSMHSGPGPSQGNSLLRPRDPMHMIRPGHNAEPQRQVIVPEQATQSTSQGIPPAFSGLSSGFPKQSTVPVQTYQGHQQQQQQQQMPSQQSLALNSSHHPHLQGPNATGPQQQAYAMRLAKERQMHSQRLIHQQQQQQPQKQHLPASSALMPNVQPQPKLPISLQASNQPAAVTSMTFLPLSHQQKHHLSLHGRIPQSGASGSTNQIVKQRQRQPQQQQLQQSGRNHPQQQQQANKLLKGIGRGTMLVHHSADSSPLNGLSTAPSNKTAEKAEQIMHLGRAFYSSSGMNPVQQSKPQNPSQSSNHLQVQHKFFSGTMPLSKQLQQTPPHLDNNNDSTEAIPSAHSSSATHQTVLPAVVPSNHQHLHLQSQPKQKQAIQSDQRVIQYKQSVHPDPPNKAQADQQPVNALSSTGKTVTITTSQASVDSTNEFFVCSSAVAHQRKAIEPEHAKSAESEPSVSQELCQRQISGSPPPQEHNIGKEWQQQTLVQQTFTPQEQALEDQHQS